MRRLATCVIGVLILSSGTALAQDKGDVSGGYRYLRASGDGESESFGKGWYFDVTGHVTDMVSIVGDVGGTYKSESITEGGVTFNGDIKIHSFQGGVKFRVPTMNTNIVPFVQVLGGGVRSSFKFTAGSLSESDSSTDGIFTLSGGVDVSGMAKVGVRVQAGYFRVFEEGEGTNGFQFSVGAKIGF
jgi:hypothetical protein